MNVVQENLHLTKKDVQPKHTTMIIKPAVVGKSLMGPPGKPLSKTVAYSKTPSAIKYEYATPLTKRGNGNPSSSSRTRTSSSVPTDASHVILALSEGRGQARGIVGIAAIDVSKPTLILCQISDTQSYINTFTKINVLNPIEVLIPTSFIESVAQSRLFTLLKEQFPNLTVTSVPRIEFSRKKGMNYVIHLCAPAYNSVTLILKDKFYALSASAALLKYIEQIKHVIYSSHTIKVEYQEPENTAIIDIDSVDRLELTKSYSHEVKNSSLLSILNKCVTGVGKKLLRSTILQPPYLQQIIEARLDCVQEFLENPEFLSKIQTVLVNLSDVEHTLMFGTLIPQSAASVSEKQLNYTLRLKAILNIIEPLSAELVVARHPVFKTIYENLTKLPYKEMLDIISTIINDDAHPAKGQSGDIQRCYAVKSGINGLLDIARKTYTEIINDMRGYVDELGKTFNLSLQLHNNCRKGYHIVLMLPKTMKYMKKTELPAEFINVERHANSFSMTTNAMVNFELKMKNILCDIQRLSNVIIYKLLLDIKPYISSLYQLCDDVAQLDMLQSISQVSSITNYVRPKFSEFLELESSRHPLLDYMCPNEPVGNPVFATEDFNYHVITGPNMAGKSVYIRQIALLQIMAQIGCFVPAQKATFRLCNHIYARVGLEDNFECNASSFLLEMKEMQYIFNTVTNNSLIIIDELCRSTSCAEGSSIAFAICEELIKTKAFTFIATHFLLLTTLKDLYFNVMNWQMETLEETRGQRTGLNFTHRLIPGVTSVENYGIKLAKICGGSNFFMNQAEEILLNLAPLRKQLTSESPNSIDLLTHMLKADLRLLKLKGHLTPEIYRNKIEEFEKQTGSKFEAQVSFELQIDSSPVTSYQNENFNSTSSQTTNQNANSVPSDNIYNKNTPLTASSKETVTSIFSIEQNIPRIYDKNQNIPSVDNKNQNITSVDNKNQNTTALHSEKSLYMSLEEISDNSSDSHNGSYYSNSNVTFSSYEPLNDILRTKSYRDNINNDETNNLRNDCENNNLEYFERVSFENIKNSLAELSILSQNKNINVRNVTENLYQDNSDSSFSNDTKKESSEYSGENKNVQADKISDSPKTMKLVSYESLSQSRDNDDDCQEENNDYRLSNDLDQTSTSPDNGSSSHSQVEKISESVENVNDNFLFSPIDEEVFLRFLQIARTSTPIPDQENIKIDILKSTKLSNIVQNEASIQHFSNEHETISRTIDHSKNSSQNESNMTNMSLNSTNRNESLDTRENLISNKENKSILINNSVAKNKDFSNRTTPKSSTPSTSKLSYISWTNRLQKKFVVPYENPEKDSKSTSDLQTSKPSTSQSDTSSNKIFNINKFDINKLTPSISSGNTSSTETFKKMSQKSRSSKISSPKNTSTSSSQVIKIHSNSNSSISKTESQPKPQKTFILNLNCFSPEQTEKSSSSVSSQGNKNKTAINLTDASQSNKTNESYKISTSKVKSQHKPETLSSNSEKESPSNDHSNSKVSDTMSQASNSSKGYESRKRKSQPEPTNTFILNLNCLSPKTISPMDNSSSNFNLLNESCNTVSTSKVESQQKPEKAFISTTSSNSEKVSNPSNHSSSKMSDTTNEISESSSKVSGSCSMSPVIKKIIRNENMYEKLPQKRSHDFSLRKELLEKELKNYSLNLSKSENLSELRSSLNSSKMFFDAAVSTLDNLIALNSPKSRKLESNLDNLVELNTPKSSKFEIQPTYKNQSHVSFANRSTFDDSCLYKSALDDSIMHNKTENLKNISQKVVSSINKSSFDNSELYKSALSHVEDSSVQNAQSLENLSEKDSSNMINDSLEILNKCNLPLNQTENKIQTPLDTNSNKCDSSKVKTKKVNKPSKRTAYMDNYLKNMKRMKNTQSSVTSDNVSKTQRISKMKRIAVAHRDESGQFVLKIDKLKNKKSFRKK